MYCFMLGLPDITVVVVGGAVLIIFFLLIFWALSWKEAEV